MRGQICNSPFLIFLGLDTLGSLNDGFTIDNVCDLCVCVCVSMGGWGVSQLICIASTSSKAESCE